MGNKKIYRRREIKRVRDYILTTFPWAQKVDVKVQKDKAGLFRSKIRVLAPYKKEIIATKCDENPKRSLEKSRQAVLRQVDKVKHRWNKKINLRCNLYGTKK